MRLLRFNLLKRGVSDFQTINYDAECLVFLRQIINRVPINTSIARLKFKLTLIVPSTPLIDDETCKHTLSECADAMMRLWAENELVFDDNPNVCEQRILFREVLLPIYIISDIVEPHCHTVITVVIKYLLIECRC